MSAADALRKYYQRTANRTSGAKPKRKNSKPEFELKKLVVKWLDEKSFSCDVVESKAVYCASAGRYLKGQAKAGFSDIVGVTPCRGVACYIELKAPGKLSTLKAHQRDFLIAKIEHMAFACVVDSVKSLSELYEKWCALFVTGNYIEAKKLLLKNLPSQFI
jgi:hypothetical protein